jgi:hypothetical protein
VLDLPDYPVSAPETHPSVLIEEGFVSSASVSHPVFSTYDQLDELCANVIRGLAMDGVQKADSGHPGMPMGMATVAHVL